MSLIRDIFLRNTDDERINPATSDIQDELNKEISTTQNELLNSILLELRKINTHMAQITDEEIKEEDVLCL